MCMQLALPLRAPEMISSLSKSIKDFLMMLQVRQVISLVTSHPYLPFCRHIIPIFHFISIENIFGFYIFC